MPFRLINCRMTSFNARRASTKLTFEWRGPCMVTSMRCCVLPDSTLEYWKLKLYISRTSEGLPGFSCIESCNCSRYPRLIASNTPVSFACLAQTSYDSALGRLTSHLMIRSPGPNVPRLSTFITFPGGRRSLSLGKFSCAPDVKFS